MNTTKIEWVRNFDGSPGFTWNPITGCLNNCSYCYARKLARGRLKKHYGRHEAPFAGTAEDPFAPRFWKHLCEEPKWRKKPAIIFAVDMGDMFGPWVPERIQQQVLDTVRETPRHTYLFLTKFPERLKHFNPWPGNCWVGATATDLKTYTEGHYHLSEVEANVRYLSMEPLLGEFRPAQEIEIHALEWVILGAQTHPLKMPDRESVDTMMTACDQASIPVFLKDNLQPLFPGEALRQEFPASTGEQTMPITPSENA